MDYTHKKQSPALEYNYSALHHNTNKHKVYLIIL